jgi:small-conductance mechanosensitive channel
MEDASIWLDRVRQSLLDLASAFIAYLPDLLFAIILLVIGWLLARFLRASATRINNYVNRLLETIAPTGRLASFRLSGRGTTLVGHLLYWLVLFIFVAAAARAAEFETLTYWLDEVVGLLPNLLGGATIVLIGYAVSIAVRDLVSTTLASAEIRQSEQIGVLVQWTALLAGIVLALEQIGIDVTFLIVVLAIVLGGAVAGVAIAFGFGARSLVESLIGAQYLQRQYMTGQTLAVGPHAGRVLEIGATSITLETDDGRTTLPGSVYFDERITLQVIEDDND